MNVCLVAKMVVLRMSTETADDQQNYEIKEKIEKPFYYLVRVCEEYKSLFKNCKRISSRIHQYYVYGDLLDCNIHNDNYSHCLNYRKKKNLDSLNPIIEWENAVMDARNKSVLNNKAWQLRDRPPIDFDGPLPEFLRRRQKESSFSRY